MISFNFCFLAMIKKWIIWVLVWIVLLWIGGFWKDIKKDTQYLLKVQNPWKPFEWSTWELKLPPYPCEPWKNYSFYLKKNPIPLAFFTDLQGSWTSFDTSWDSIWTFYAYPLAHLNIDLNLKKIKVNSPVFTQRAYSISGNLNDEACWFTTYQAQDRKEDEIIAFLEALLKENLSWALQLLEKNQNLIPFLWVFDVCSTPSWKIEKIYLTTSLLCNGGSGPEFLKFKLFVAAWSLYLTIEEEDNPNQELLFLLEEELKKFSW